MNSSNTIQSEDVNKIVSDLKFDVNEEEVNEVVRRVNETNVEDGIDPWYVVVEDTLYEVIGERE